MTWNAEWRKGAGGWPKGCRCHGKQKTEGKLKEMLECCFVTFGFLFFIIIETAGLDFVFFFTNRLSTGAARISISTTSTTHQGLSR